MLSKRFHIGKSQTRSRISFTTPESKPHGDVQRGPFRDPAAVPFLEGIAEALKSRGYEVTEPKPGKACHGGCAVTFPEVQIEIVLLVRRRQGNIEFEILTWPSQSMRQRMRSGTREQADCQEWEELCSAIHSIVVADSRLKSVRLRTFAQGEAEYED
jgi:hypothetical protein